MKLSKKLILVIVLGAFFYQNGISQTAAKELNKIMEKYKKLETISLEVEVHAFYDENDKSGIVVAKGEMKKKKDKYYNLLGKNEIIVNGKNMLIVDHEDKEIVLAKAGNIKDIEQQIQGFSLDSLLANGVTISLEGNENNKRKFRIDSPDSFIKRIYVFVNNRNLIERLVYFYQSTPEAESAYYKVEVRYDKISLAPPSDENFDEQKYIKNRTRHGADLKPGFEDYSVKVANYNISY